MPIKRLLKSFSFRLSLLIFVVFLTALFIVRYTLYYSAINEAEREVKTIITEQENDITEAIDKRGIEYGLNIISTIIENDHEKLFAIAYLNSKGKMLEGNLDGWPDMEDESQNWQSFELEVKLDSDEDDNNEDNYATRQYLATVKTYKSGSKLLVGYDMRHILNIKRVVLNVMWQNILFSFLAAVICSLIITSIISKRLRELNRTCENVIDGRLEERAILNGSNDEFDRLASNFNSMLVWINQLISNIKNTTDNLAHDMRTPLNRHRIRLQNIISSQSSSDATKKEVSEAVEEIDKVVEMFNSILNISKAEAKSEIEGFKEFDLKELIDDLMDLYGFLAEEKNIALTSKVNGSIKFNGDRQLFAQALMNLVDNAIKYTPDSGKIQISAVKEQGNVKIVIADNGPGIPSVYYEKVKERFYRLDTSRTTTGNGLGLSLVNAVVRLHDGQMSFADNNPGLKVILTFSL